MLMPGTSGKSDSQNPLFGKSLLSIRDFSRKDIECILDDAEVMNSALSSGGPQQVLQNKIMATLFYEPSTRTRLSFESSMQKLGGGIIGFADKASSSVMKGESLADTVRVVSAYSDVIVLRHSQAGAAAEAARFSRVPLINAGDGSGEHPTQALLDLFTIRKEKGTLEGLDIAIVGDLKNSRTEHSLAYALSMFGNRMTFIAPKELQMPDNICADLTGAGSPGARKAQSLDEAIASDVIYINRIQKERFEDPAQAERFTSAFRIDSDFMKRAGSKVTIMNPLPRMDEVSSDIDMLDNSAYFRQAAYGVPVRMAILKMMLSR